MSRGLVVIAHNALADPRRTGAPAEAHLIHDEIPIIEEALRAAGWEALGVPVGADILGALGLLAARRPRVVVNLCDDLLGRSDHEMHFAGALELLDIPYTGAPPLALGLCRDKAKTKLILAGHGIPTAPFVLAERPDAPLGGLRFPVIAKPAAEDGSLGITDASVAADEAGARRAIAAGLTAYGPVLVEEFIEGRELNVPVLGNDPPRVLPISEIDFGGLPAGLPHICGYEAKWAPDDPRYAGTAGICPAVLDGALRERVERWSVLAFRSLGLRDYARVDWRLSPTRGPLALEANPNPDISPTSGFLRSVRAAGMDYPELIAQLVEGTLARA
jgi:D-alanine-D-alanine ligase